MIKKIALAAEKIKNFFKKNKEEIFISGLLILMLGGLTWLITWFYFLSPLARGLKELGL